MAKLFVVAFSSVIIVATSLMQEATSITNSITLAGAIATIIAAVFVGIVNVITARKAIAPIKEKVDKIEAHVNSESTRYQGVIATQKQQIDLQREMIDELRKAAALLAQAKQASETIQAVAQAAVAGATGTVRPPVAEETATNTKKTEATVQELKDKS